MLILGHKNTSDNKNHKLQEDMQIHWKVAKLKTLRHIP